MLIIITGKILLQDLNRSKTKIKLKNQTSKIKKYDKVVNEGIIIFIYRFLDFKINSSAKIVSK
jgi:hypothetical protein